MKRTANGDRQRAAIQPGMACIEPVGLDESEAEIFSPLTCLHIHLDPALIEHSALTDLEINPAKAKLGYAGGLRDPLLNQIALTLLGVISRGLEPADRLLVSGARSILTWHLLDKYSVDRWRTSSTKPSLSHRRLERVLDLIEARFREQIALHDLAKEAGLSDFHFCRLFREATGLSPYRYVIQRRIEAAQAKLARGNSSLVEVALEMGFGSQASFNRAFRQHTGQTPGQFRARSWPDLEKSSGH